MRLMTYCGFLVILTGLLFEVGIASSLVPYRFVLLGFGVFVGWGLRCV
jgi:hypothetical protein